jgi:class 3 adenylate cyclase
MDEYLKPGESFEITYNTTVYDILERSIIQLIKVTDIYQEVSQWIIRKLDPCFVLFSANAADSAGKDHYFLLRKGEENDVSLFFSERKKAGIGIYTLFVHQSGGISLPYITASGSAGCLYLGSACSGQLYTRGQVKELMPVLRILNKALLTCEAYQVNVERSRLEDAFSHYVSPDIVQDIIHNPDTMHLGGEKRFLTCVFTDLEGFTSLSDSMDPILLVRVLNMYLTEMSQVIISLGGVIDKFEGDAIMAFFGAPHELKDHAVRCCLSALRMKQMEQVLNEQLQKEKLIQKPLFTRIGINSGDMVVGNVGSLQRLDYTVIGSNVNIASRLENANKNFNTSILISGETYELVKDYFDCRCFGSIMLRGVSQPVKVYQLLGEKRDVNLSYDNFPVCTVETIQKNSVTVRDVEYVEEL